MYQLSTHEDVLVLSVAARQLTHLDSVARFERELRRLVRERPERHWLIDFHDVTFFITPAVNTLLTILRTLASRGGRLVLTGISADVRYILGLRRVDAVLTILPTREAGLELLGAGGPADPSAQVG